ncbi:hypothetical protein AGABI1DRAFT_134084 [Agaricus bisporus var. burnettii JB137-S8]|uniref:Uncharacterized protein n=1 Tax=Agaricus bisporus var. burnettii (strain JB137-S8 / ATCC MYA-4627 / FGSC 10392) TaxID=597362 RepID=K5WEV2_AGABU|nr:uncharacterized protein AGABI1DRAFT_134084 [Agaricus bisporus var. burnettii JB137-S8]EKM73791.1 hypothetical protein AGABI1DRAFT_134084 [Agaricus bisporus var. burnettii JB137-S8]
MTKIFKVAINPKMRLAATVPLMKPCSTLLLELSIGMTIRSRRKWLGELSSSSKEGNWRWYTTPDEDGCLHFPMDNSFLKCNQAAIAKFKASKHKAKSGEDGGDKQA